MRPRAFSLSIAGVFAFTIASQPSQQDSKKEFELRQAEKRKEALATLDQVQRELEDEAKEKPKPTEEDLLWERGRRFVADRKWKEAQQAFSKASESKYLELSYDLEKLLGGQGGFHGQARRTGRDALRLQWDFQDPDQQIKDFSAGLKSAERSVVLESALKAAVFLMGGTSRGTSNNPLSFAGEISVETKLSCDGAASFFFFVSRKGGYGVELDSKGTTIFKRDPTAPDQRKPLARSDKVKIASDKPATVRLTVRYPQFQVSVNGGETFTVEEKPAAAPPPKGMFGIGIDKGRLKIDAPLVVQGRVEPDELDRRNSESEVMVRRALDPDLKLIEEYREWKIGMRFQPSEDWSLSADEDLYFVSRLGPADDGAYRELRRQIGFIEKKRDPEGWADRMGRLIEKRADVPSLYYVRALFRRDHQDDVGALDDARKAVKLFPDFHEALALEGEILLEQRDPESALKAAGRALAARPDFSRGYLLRARCLLATSPAGPTIEKDLAIARKLNPAHPTKGEVVLLQQMLKFQRSGLRELGCRFDSETTHYKVTTDISADAARRYGENLEAAFGYYTSSFTERSGKDRGKPRVAIFHTAENYYNYFELLSENRGESTLGVFRPDLNELVLFESSDLAETHHTLYHEAFHQFMTLLTTRHPPYWYNEGIAEYMGAIRVEGGAVKEKGRILDARLEDIQHALKAKADLPFEEIMNETPREFYGTGNPSLKYAQAWAMIHFFYEKHRGKIDAYFAALRAGRTTRQAYDEIFKQDAKTLEEEWRKYTLDLKPAR